MTKTKRIKTIKLDSDVVKVKLWNRDIYVRIFSTTAEVTMFVGLNHFGSFVEDCLTPTIKFNETVYRISQK